MFNVICPPVYKQLRKRSGLSQGEFGKEIGVTRYFVGKLESGKALADESLELRMLEVANCSLEEFAELVFEQLSKLIDRPVGVRETHDGYEPTTALAKAYRLTRCNGGEIPPAMMRALNNKITMTRLMSLACERNTADLLELAQDCAEELANTGDEKPNERPTADRRITRRAR